MKFYCIDQSKPSAPQEGTSGDLLHQACEKKGILFELIDPRNFDFLNPPTVAPGDIVYRISRGVLSRSVERFLIHEKVATFYATYQRAFQYYDDLFLNRINHLPMPKTIFGVTSNYEILKKYGQELGFPMILKILGKSLGNGVIKIDSLDALSSTVTYLGTDAKERFVLKEFIASGYSVRVIVVGEKVVATISYRSKRGDFRSNIEKNPLIEPFALTPEIETLAIQAAKTIDLEFGGVDILIDKTGKAYLAEINFPCAFPDAQFATGIDIALHMVDYLQAKSARLTQ